MSKKNTNIYENLKRSPGPDSSEDGETRRRKNRSPGVKPSLPYSRSSISSALRDDEEDRNDNDTAVNLYGISISQHTLGTALDDAATIRDSSDTYGRISFKEEDFEKSGELYDKANENVTIEVEWDGRDDQEDNRRMAKIRKCIITCLLSFNILQIALSSSIWQQSIDKIKQEFKITNDFIATLGVTVYMAGMALGPCFSSLAELTGRKCVYIIGFIIYIALQLLTVLGKNMQMLIIGRAFTGFGGGMLITTAFGTISDLFSQEKMGSPMVMISMAPFLGPVVSPLISSFVSEILSFQWVFRIMVIWSGVMAILVLSIVPETYGPVLLARKAKRIRKQTKNQNFQAPLDKERKFLGFFKTLFRPFVMLFSDGVLFYFCFFAGLLNGIIYSFFTAFPYVFQTVYKWQRKMQGISFLGIAAGMIIASLTQPFWKRCYKKLTKNSHGQDEAEYWLPELMFGNIIASLGLLMFGWTDLKNIHSVVPIVGTGIFGFGALLCFTSIYSYIVDGYRKYSVSGVAGCMFVTSIFGALFPLFAGEFMYKHVGVHWAPTIFGLVILCGFPMVIIMFIHGTVWRDKSRYSCNNTLT